MTRVTLLYSFAKRAKSDLLLKYLLEYKICNSTYFSWKKKCVN